MDNGGIIGPTNTLISRGGGTTTVKTSNGNITTQPGTTRANVLVVAGGGGGADSGGGAGGLVFIKRATICGATAYPAVIGGGGNAGVNGQPSFGTAGNCSTFFCLTAKGGGRGTSSNTAGQPGGSGSGAGGTDAGSNLSGGTASQGSQPGL